MTLTDLFPSLIQPQLNTGSGFLKFVYALVSFKFPTLWKMYVYILADETMIFCVDFRTRRDTCKMTTIVCSRAKAVKDSIDLTLINLMA